MGKRSKWRIHNTESSNGIVVNNVGQNDNIGNDENEIANNQITAMESSADIANNVEQSVTEGKND